MLLLTSLLVLFSFASIQAQSPTPADRVEVAVYYESLCPDSIKFITKQLYPTLQTDLGKYVNLTLIPFGKASQTFENGYQFTCHHGPNECDGNKVQACAIALIDRGQKSMNLGYNKILLGFVDCLMEKVTRNPYNLPGQECATRNNVPQYEAIEQCRTSEKGSELLSNLGHLTTAAVDPSNKQAMLSSVPTIIFNKKYDEKDSKMAQESFAKTLCSKIVNKPEKLCKDMSGGSSARSLATAALLGAVVLFYMF